MFSVEDGCVNWQFAPENKDAGWSTYGMAHYVLKQFTAFQRNTSLQTGLGRVRAASTVHCHAHILYPLLKPADGQVEIDQVELEKLLVVPRPNNVQLRLAVLVNDTQMHPQVHKMVQEMLLEQGIQPSSWITALARGMDSTVAQDDDAATILLYPLNPSSFPPCTNLVQSTIFGQLQRIELKINIETKFEQIQEVIHGEWEEWQVGILPPLCKAMLSILLGASVNMRAEFPLVFSKLVPQALPHLIQHAPSIASSLRNILARRNDFDAVNCLTQFTPSAVGNPGMPDNSAEDSLRKRLLYGLYRNAEAMVIKIDQRRAEPRDLPIEWQAPPDQDLFADEFEDLLHDSDDFLSGDDFLNRDGFLNSGDFLNSGELDFTDEYDFGVLESMEEELNWSD